MVSASRFGVVLGAALATLLIAGCDMLGRDKQDPQQKLALTGPASGGRSTEPAPAATTPAAAPAKVPAVAAGGVDFGDDASKFSRDGECDDKRFSGPGMTDTPLLDSDVRHDATDCRAAWDQHRLTMASGSSGSSGGGYAESGVNHIMWGDDAGKFSKDGECDDKRFTGPGMTNTPLLDSDIKHDATDCRAAFSQGRLQLAGG
jgi:hypothetical protein